MQTCAWVWIYRWTKNCGKSGLKAAGHRGPWAVGRRLPGLWAVAGLLLAKPKLACKEESILMGDLRNFFHRKASENVFPLIRSIRHSPESSSNHFCQKGEIEKFRKNKKINQFDQVWSQMKAKFMHLCRSRFSALQYSGKFSFLVTANEIEACVTGRMRAQWNFRGVKLSGAWGRIGKGNIALQVTALWNSYCFNSTSFCVSWNNKELSTKSTEWLLKFWSVHKSRLIFCGDSFKT